MVRVEAIHLIEKLVESLLPLIVAPHGHGARTRLAYSVDLVDEDDARRLGLRLVEQVAHPRRADANEHLDELGATYREKGHAGLAGGCFGDQGLARAWWTYEQDSLRQLSAELDETIGLFEKLDDLLELLLHFVDPGHIAEGDTGHFARDLSGLALADRHHAPWSTAHTLHEEPPDQHEGENRQDPT